MPKKGNRPGREEKRRGKSIARPSRFGSKSVSEALHTAPAASVKVAVSEPVNEPVSAPRHSGSLAHHERPWSHLIVQGTKTTPAVANAKARKLHYRRQKVARDQAQAKRQGISVAELHFRQAAEVRQIVADRNRIVAKSALSRGDDDRRRY